MALCWHSAAVSTTRATDGGGARRGQRKNRPAERRPASSVVRPTRMLQACAPAPLFAFCEPCTPLRAPQLVHFTPLARRRAVCVRARSDRAARRHSLVRAEPVAARRKAELRDAQCSEMLHATFVFTPGAPRCGHLMSSPLLRHAHAVVPLGALRFTSRQLAVSRISEAVGLHFRDGARTPWPCCGQPYLTRTL